MRRLSLFLGQCRTLHGHCEADTIILMLLFVMLCSFLYALLYKNVISNLCIPYLFYTHFLYRSFNILF